MVSPVPCLNSLPDDVVLRIVSLTGTMGIQVRTAFRLGCTSRRLRRLLVTVFLSDITELNQDLMSELALVNRDAARAAISAMFSKLPAVRIVNLSGCSPTLLSRDSIHALATAARTSLIEVNLEYCQVTDHVVRPLLDCPSLRVLNLFRCSSVTGVMFHDYAPSLSRGSARKPCAPLESLDLSWALALTRQSIHSIARISTIANLVMTGCDCLDTSTLMTLADGPIAASLTSVGLSYCPLTDRALSMLLERAPNLLKVSLAEQTVNLWSVGEFSEAFLGELRTRFPGVSFTFST